MGPTWGPSGADRTQVGRMLAPWAIWDQYAELLESTEHTKILVRYIRSRVCLRCCLFLPSSCMKYMGLPVSGHPFLFWWSREYLHFIFLSSSNQRYDSLAIVIKQIRCIRNYHPLLYHIRRQYKFHIYPCCKYSHSHSLPAWGPLRD